MPAGFIVWRGVGHVRVSANQRRLRGGGACRGAAGDGAAAGELAALVPMSMACWGQERLDAVDRTLALMPDFAPSYLVGAMVFVAPQPFPAAEALAAKGAARQSLEAASQAFTPSERGVRPRVEGPASSERGISARVEGAFPAFGLHWLLGLLQLRKGDVAGATLRRCAAL